MSTKKEGIILKGIFHHFLQTPGFFTLEDFNMLLESFNMKIVKVEKSETKKVLVLCKEENGKNILLNLPDYIEDVQQIERHLDCLGFEGYKYIVVN
jgi:hypothetical protein